MNYFSYIYIYIIYFKLFFILLLFYFIKISCLITILFSINNYYIFLIIRKYNVIIKKFKIKKGLK